MTDPNGDGGRGQSSTLATVLMVAVALVTVGALALFVGGVADTLSGSAPSSTFDVEYDADRGVLTLEHGGGASLDADNTRRLTVQVEDADSGTVTEFTWLGPDGTAANLTAGDALTLDDAGGAATGDHTLAHAAFEAGDTVRVVWHGTGGGSAVLRSYTVPESARGYVAWDVDPTDDLERRYDFDAVESRVVADESGSGTTYDGTPSGPESGVDGKVGDAFAFDGGEQDYVALPKRYDAAGALPTVSACTWFRTSESAGQWDNWAFLDFDRSEYFNLFVYGDGRVGFSTTDETGALHDMATPGSYNDGSWHHACGVYDGTDKHVYVDGSLVATASNPHGGDALGTGTTRYGYLGDGSESSSFDGARNDFHYTGRLDQVRLYERELTTNDVQDLYVAETGGNATAPTTDLVAFYPLEDDLGGGTTTVRDTGESPAQDGTPTAVTFGPGVSGGGATFDDAGYVALEGAYDEAGALPTVTACGWFRTSVASGGQFDNWAIVDFDRSEYFNLYVHGDGRVGFSTTDTTGQIDDFYTTNSYNDGDWHHTCAVYDGTTKAIYVDGDLKVQANAHSGRALGTGTTRYGYLGDGSESSTFDGARNGIHYDGSLDDVRVYHRDLGADAVERLYQATGGSPGDTTFETATATYPRALDADRLVLEDVRATIPAGTNVTVTVLADPDGDGTFEETSDPIRLDGSDSYDVSGISSDSSRFRLRVELDASGGVSPTFSGAQLGEDD
jgi:FlaG/FlaF family flagellin (archaellin)